MERGSWWATGHGVTKSRTRLSMWHKHIYIVYICIYSACIHVHIHILNDCVVHLKLTAMVNQVDFNKKPKDCLHV